MTSDHLPTPPADDVRLGKLDKGLVLSSGGAPVLLGFLNLALELVSSRPAVHLFSGLFEVDWRFTRDRLVLHVAGSVAHPSTSFRHQISLTASLEASNLATGHVGMVDVVPNDAILVYTRKGGQRHREVSMGLRLLILDEARPIGRVPTASNGTFQAISA